MQEGFRNGNLVGGSMKTKKKTSLFDVCNTLIMLAVLFLAAYPLYYTVIASL